MADNATGPLFKWFGSKWTASKHYPTPSFDTVVEPFAGGAGYSLRHAHKDIYIAETDPHIYALWHWLIHEATEADVRSIPLNLPTGADIRAVGLSQGQELLLKTWQRTNNVGSCWTTSPWGNLPGQWTENTRSRVSEEMHLVKHWTLASTAASLLNQNVLATGFIDPPYQFNYQYKSPPLDYEDLAKQLQQLPGELIVCEAACTKTGRLPDWLPFVPFRDTVTSRRKATNNHHSRELMFYSSPCISLRSM